MTATPIAKSTETETSISIETPIPSKTLTITGTPIASAVPTELTPEPLQNANYTYDGDGNLVKSVIIGKPTYFLGKLYQKKIDGTTTTI